VGRLGGAGRGVAAARRRHPGERTHALVFAHETDGRLFINPGTATGAFSPIFRLVEEPIPSFVLMDVQAQRVVIYVYELVNDEVKVKKIEHTKVERPTFPSFP